MICRGLWSCRRLRGLGGRGTGTWRSSPHTMGRTPEGACAGAVGPSTSFPPTRAATLPAAADAVIANLSRRHCSDGFSTCEHGGSKVPHSAEPKNAQKEIPQEGPQNARLDVLRGQNSTPAPGGRRMKNPHSRPRIVQSGARKNNGRATDQSHRRAEYSCHHRCCDDLRLKMVWS